MAILDFISEQVLAIFLFTSHSNAQNQVFNDLFEGSGAIAETVKT